MKQREITRCIENDWKLFASDGKFICRFYIGDKVVIRRVQGSSQKIDKVKGEVLRIIHSKNSIEICVRVQNEVFAFDEAIDINDIKSMEVLHDDKT